MISWAACNRIRPQLHIIYNSFNLYIRNALSHLWNALFGECVVANKVTKSAPIIYALKHIKNPKDAMSPKVEQLQQNLLLSAKFWKLLVNILILVTAK